MPVDKHQKQKATTQILQSLAMIASLTSNIEHYFPDLSDDPGAMEGISNRMAEEIGNLREVFNTIARTRFVSLLPDSGVKFEMVEPPTPGEGITD